MATTAAFDIKTPLASKLDMCDRQLRMLPSPAWFTNEFENRTLSTQGELDALTQMLSDNVRPSAERTELMEEVHALRNLLTSWYEGVAQSAVGRAAQDAWRRTWTATMQNIRLTLAKIVQAPAGANQSLVLDDDEATEEAATVQVPRKSTGKEEQQRTLFTTEARMKQNPALKEFKLEGAEDAIAEWKKTRGLIPLARTKGAPLFALARVPIIPSMERIADTETFKRLGIKSRSIGMYHILYDQIILGLNMHRVREKSISHVERDDLIERQLAKLSEHYGTKMVLATDSIASMMDNGYQFYWVMSEATLSMMQSRANNYPTGWSLT